MEHAPDQPEKNTAPASQPAEDAANPTYGGNFGNSMEPVYKDEDRRENQLAGPERGEFGAHDSGNTHGGYGNQFRPTEAYYGGDVEPQPVSSGGFRGGEPENNTGQQEPGQQPGDDPQGSTFGTEAPEPEESRQSSVGAYFENDNAAPEGTGAGYSADYGRSSLSASAPELADAQPASGQRNQTEDYRPSQPDADEPAGQKVQPEPTGSSPAELSGRGEASTGTPPTAADEADADARTGYTKAAGETGQQGDAAQGIGSKGGSYNDPTTPMNPDAGANSPDKDNYSRDAQNTAPVPPQPTDEQTDYGAAPRRNEGRDNG